MTLMTSATQKSQIGNLRTTVVHFQKSYGGGPPTSDATSTKNGTTSAKTVVTSSKNGITSTKTQGTSTEDATTSTKTAVISAKNW